MKKFVRKIYEKRRGGSKILDLHIFGQHQDVLDKYGKKLYYTIYTSYSF